MKKDIDSSIRGVKFASESFDTPSLNIPLYNSLVYEEENCGREQRRVKRFVVFVANVNELITKLNVGVKEIIARRLYA